MAARYNTILNKMNTFAIPISTYQFHQTCATGGEEDFTWTTKVSHFLLIIKFTIDPRSRAFKS